MPDFDIDQWLQDNGYADADGNLESQDISETLGDYWGGQFDNISGVFDVGEQLTGNAADPIASHMYSWSLENEGYSDEDFAEELFLQLYNSSDTSSQNEFINTWNNNYVTDENVPQIEGSGEDLQQALAEAAQYWAETYGTTMGGEGFFNTNITLDDYQYLQANMGTAIDEYNTAWGDEAFSEMYEGAASNEADFENRSENLTAELLNTIKGLEIQSGSILEQYDLLNKKTLSEESARGVRGAGRKGLGSGSFDLELFENQLNTLSVQDEAAGATHDAEQELLGIEWENLLEQIYGDFSLGQDSAFADLTFNIDDLVDDYNAAVLAGSEELQSSLYDQLAAIVETQGVTPPIPGSDHGANSGFSCVTPSGYFGTICPNGTANVGQCVSNVASCDDDGDTSGGSGDDDGFGPPPPDPEQCPTEHYWDEELQTCVPSGNSNVEDCPQGQQMCPSDSDFPYTCATDISECYSTNQGGGSGGNTGGDNGMGGEIVGGNTGDDDWPGNEIDDGYFAGES